VTPQDRPLPLDDEEFRRDASEPGDAIRAGRIAIVPYERLRDQLRLPAEAGLILDDRRNVVQVYFPTPDRTWWIERAKLRVVAPDRLALHPLIERLHRIATLLDAEAIDLYDEHDGVGVFHVFSRGLSLEDLLAIRSLVGDDLRHLRIDPGTMRRTRLTIAFRLPGA
jgi:hypothetical protein